MVIRRETRLDSRKPAAEVTVSSDRLGRLLAEQHPDLAHAALARVDEGWDNVTYRIGVKWAARLPRRAESVQRLLNEQRWLPELAANLDIETPVPERVGHPSSVFPWPWSIVRWIEGSPADIEPLGEGQGARLAGVLRELHRSAPDEAPPNPFRGVPLRDRAELVDERLSTLDGLGGDAVKALRRFWIEGKAAPKAGDPVWIHGDLHPKNALVHEGELVGLIDWGDLTGGDPATDLAAAWTILRSDEERQAFWDRYGWTEPIWLRARAWAVLFGVLLYTSKEDRHETMGRSILDELLGSTPGKVAYSSSGQFMTRTVWTEW